MTKSGVTAISEKDLTTNEPHPVNVGEFQSQERIFFTFLINGNFRAKGFYHYPRSLFLNFYTLKNSDEIDSNVYLIK